MKITRSGQFEKFFKKYINNKSVLFEFKKVINFPASDEPLPKKYKNRELKGKFKGLRELHLKPDDLLVYKINEDTITSIAMGGRSKIF